MSAEHFQFRPAIPIEVTEEEAPSFTKWHQYVLGRARVLFPERVVNEWASQFDITQVTDASDRQFLPPDYQTFTPGDSGITYYMRWSAARIGEYYASEKMKLDNGAPIEALTYIGTETGVRL